VPDEDPAVSEVRRDLGRGLALEVERERCDPTVHRLIPVEGDAVGQTVEEPLPQITLMSTELVPVERLEVLDRGDEAGEELVLHRP
jgi:hypothetical protein